MKNAVMLVPDIELEPSNPLYAGVNAAVITVSRMLADKIDEYGSLDKCYGNALRAFQIQYDAYFHEELKRTIEWEARRESDSSLKAKFDKIQGNK